jgi:uncharacterized protein (DUF983 family)
MITPNDAPGARPVTDAETPRLSKLASIGLCKCPRCRKGNMFMYRAYHLKGFAHMHDECPHCGQDFIIEPGFYMMAAYVGYINFVVVIVALAFSGFALFPENQDWITIALSICLTLLLVPANFRISRSLNLHLFGSVRYNPNAGKATSGFFVGPDGELRDGEPREEYRPGPR